MVKIVGTKFSKFSSRLRRFGFALIIPDDLRISKTREQISIEYWEDEFKKL